MRNIFIIIYSLLAISCSSISNKEWPHDAYYQLRQGEGVSLDCKFVEAISGSSTKAAQYAQNLLSRLKSNYPNFADFEEAVLRNDPQISDARILELKYILSSYSLDRVWEIIANNSPEVQSLKSQSPSTYNQLRRRVMNGLDAEFLSLSSFIESLSRDGMNTHKKIENIVAKAIEQMNL